MSDAAEFDVRVVPRSSQEKLEVEAGSSLKIWVRASPTDGQANEALTRLISKTLGLPKSSVSIVRGHSSRSKRIRIEGIEPSEALKRLS